MNQWTSDICLMIKVSRGHLLPVTRSRSRGSSPSSETITNYFFFISVDPYGYNEKKRRRENIMRISGLSSKRNEDTVPHRPWLCVWGYCPAAEYIWWHCMMEKYQPDSKVLRTLLAPTKCSLISRGTSTLHRAFIVLLCSPSFLLLQPNHSNLA